MLCIMLHMKAVKATLVWVMGSILCLGGCDAITAPNDIRANYDMVDRALMEGDSATALDFIDPAVFDYYDRLLDVALDAGPTEIKAMPPSHIMVILMMRNRCTVDELESMDGRDFAVHAINRQWIQLPTVTSDQAPWYLRESPETLSIGKVRASGDHGTIQILRGNAPTDHAFGARKLEGIWKIDITGADGMIDQLVREVANRELRSPDGVVLKNEDMDLDGKIWQPLRR